MNDQLQLQISNFFANENLKTSLRLNKSDFKTIKPVISAIDFAKQPSRTCVNLSKTGHGLAFKKPSANPME